MKPIPLRRSLKALAASLMLSTAMVTIAAPNPEPLAVGTDAVSNRLQTIAKQRPKPAAVKKAPMVDGVPVDRYGIPMADDRYGDSAKEIVYLDQNWTPAQSLAYYFTDQGSQLFDYSVFMALERADNPELMSSPSSMARYRYLPQRPSKENPDGLPIGFLKRTANKAAYLSMTCGACHTAQINYKGKGMRIDGAGAQADFVGFLNGVQDALAANLADSAKLERLTKRLYGPNPTPAQQSAAAQRVGANLEGLRQYIKRNPSQINDGYARVDAVGRIYNQVLYAVHATQFLSPDAPVSYPFLWDASHHDYVQWLGLTPNAGPGALGRNAGEVIGVFGEIQVKKQTNRLTKLEGYASSVQAKNLVSYEQWLFNLKSPKWPENILPKLDADKVKRGESHYMQACVSCHRTINRDDPKRLVYAQMYGLNVVGTDPKEIQNALRPGQTGILEGAITSITSSTKYGPQAPVAQMLSDLVSGALLKNVDASLQATEDAKSWGLGITSPAKQGEYPQDPNNPFASLAAYKARPLNGIWATAPYLHNGSVPSLYHLLLPASQRPARFAVGQLEFDPTVVGYRNNPDDPNAPFVFDTRLPGNSNQGHEFGTGLSEEQRLELLEYLKSL